MSIQAVLLPVFVLVGLAFALLLWMAGARRGALVGGETRIGDIALGQPNWPARATQIGNCFSNQFEMPLLYYVLIAIALPLRHADLVIVMLSWVFVVTRFAHAGIFVTFQRSQATLAGVVCRRAGAARDVALFRAEDPIVDLNARAWRSFQSKALRTKSFCEPKVLNDSRSAALRGHRTDRHHRYPARSSGEGAEGMGHRASLCRLRRSRRDLRPDLGCAAAARIERVDHGRRYAARPPARHASARTQSRCRCDRRFMRWRPVRARTVDRSRARRAWCRDRLPTRRPTLRATIRNGSTDIWRKSSAMTALPRRSRWRAARRSICASTR